MKVLVLEGSPHKKGSSNLLADEFIKGVKENNHQVEVFDVAHANIKPCLGCDYCGMNGPCVQKDDMQKIYPAYKDADIVVLASPMYYWGISGQLKCAFDRLFAVAELTPNYENPKKDCILLMAAEGDTEHNFAPVRAFYEGLTAHLGWKSIGIVYAGGNMDAGAIFHKPEQLEEAETLGRSIS